MHYRILAEMPTVTFQQVWNCPARCTNII